jgi:arylsulfatase A-like enzyme
MPGTIPAGQHSSAIISTFDFYPTFYRLANGHTVRKSAILDGIDMSEYLLGRQLDAAIERAHIRPLFFYCNQHLMAIRYGIFKIHLMTSPIYNASDGFRNDCPDGRPKTDWYGCFI